MEKKMRKRKFRLINGPKGAISLFMAVLMTPFLTIAMILVETGRYNSMVSLLDEVMGVSSLSVLANYDDYLQERWGLYAVSQGTDIDSTFNSYMETNASVMGSNVSLDKITAKGMYPLSDKDILKNQIMEYSKLNMPTKLAMETFDLADIISKLEKKVAGLSQFANMLSSGANAADNMVTLTENIEKLKDISERLEGYKKTYNTAYTDFSTAVNNLITNLQTKEALEAQLSSLNSQMKTLQSELSSLLSEESDSDEEGESEAVKAKREEISELQGTINDVNTQLTTVIGMITAGRISAGNGKTDYISIMEKIIKDLGEYKKLHAECTQAVAEFGKNIVDAGVSYGEMQNELYKKREDLKEAQKDLEAMQAQIEQGGYAEDDPAYQAFLRMEESQRNRIQEIQEQVSKTELTLGVGKATSDAMGAAIETWTEGAKDYDEKNIDVAVDAFKTQKTKVSNLDTNGITSSSTRITQGEYKFAKITGFMSVEELENFAKEQTKELEKSTLKALLDMLESVYDSVMGLSTLVQNDLDSMIDSGYYQKTFGGLPGGAATDDGVLSIIRGIGSVAKIPYNIGKAFGDLIKKPNLKNLKAFFESIYDSIMSIYNLIKDVISFAVGIVKNIVTLFLGYERIYLGTYCTYNLACRTDYNESTEHTSIKTISGYSAGLNSFPESKGSVNIPAYGDLFAIAKAVVQGLSGSGKDITFKGAELEYILLGSNSEISNQLYAFTVIYLLRILLSSATISTNAEVQSLAAAATIGYPVVMGLYMFLEPLVQTILLVNGTKQNLLPTKVYLTPSGLPDLLEALVSYCKLTNKDKENLSKKMIEVCAGSEDNYDYQMKQLEAGSTSSGTKKESSLLGLSYREHCMIWILVTVTEESMLARLQNLIQMETLYYYQQQKATYTFDIRNCFTYLNTSTKMSITQVMPSLLKSDLFTIERQQYRGY